MSTYTTTLDDTAMLVVGPPPQTGGSPRASASPLSVSSSFPPPLTAREVSVTSAVKVFADHELVIDEMLASVAAMHALRGADRGHLQRRRVRCRGVRGAQRGRGDHGEEARRSEEANHTTTTLNGLRGALHPPSGNGLRAAIRASVFHSRRPYTDSADVMGERLIASCSRVTGGVSAGASARSRKNQVAMQSDMTRNSSPPTMF